MNRSRENARMVGKLAVITVGMFAFGYALIPIYRTICEMTGINILALSERQVPGNGAAGRDAAVPLNTQVDKSRTITVEFDANARGPWQFRPAQRSIQVHPGELATVVYEFQNVQDRRMAAQAIPSYAPSQAAAHFTKLECFCFNQYTLEPGEKRLTVRNRLKAAAKRRGIGILFQRTSGDMVRFKIVPAAQMRDDTTDLETAVASDAPPARRRNARGK